MLRYSSTPAPKYLHPEQRLCRPQQNGCSTSFAFGDDVDTMVLPVDAVDVEDPPGFKHRRIPLCFAPECMVCRISLGQIRLKFNQPRSTPSIGLLLDHYSPYERPRNLQGRTLEKLAR